jgi:hypothetical protein
VNLIASISPGTLNGTLPSDQIHGAPAGTYFSGSVTMTVSQSGAVTFSNWSVFLNFAWAGGGRTAIPPPK